MKKLIVPFGTRPEITKLAPVIRALSLSGFEITTVATGQHYDANMTDVFYKQLGIEVSTTHVLSGSPAEKIGQLEGNAAQSIADVRPDAVFLMGDTNTVPAWCLEARRAGVPAIHLEAGLRSLNGLSMEEINRKVAATTASLHLAPTELAREFLLSEGVADNRIFVVGNSAIDTLVQSGVTKVDLPEREGVLVTAHRASNVDNPQRLTTLVESLLFLAETFNKVTFPVHPRTKGQLELHGLLPKLEQDPRIHLSGPIGYNELLSTMAKSKLVVTDSGGVQEEASWLGVPLIVMRTSTPRWEGVAMGASVLASLDDDGMQIRNAAERFATHTEQERVSKLPCPYGDGKTTERVVSLLESTEVWNLLRLIEEDFTDGSLPSVVKRWLRK